MADFPDFSDMGGLRRGPASSADNLQWSFRLGSLADPATERLSFEVGPQKRGDDEVLPGAHREAYGGRSPSPPGLNDPPQAKLAFQQPRSTTPPGGVMSDDEHTPGGSYTLPLKEFSGFEVALAKLGETVLNPTVVERELQWQNESMAESETEQQEFRDEMLQQQTLRAFVLIQENSPYLTICHSVGKFFNPPGENAKPLHGKYIGVMGDRTEYRDPIPVILPALAWEWKTPVVHTAVAAIKEFYTVATNYDRLYQANETPSGESTAKGKRKDTKAAQKSSVVYVNDEREVSAPFLLAIPSYILGRLSIRAYWTPWDLLQVVEDGMREYDGQIEKESWNVMRDWCLAACQPAGATPHSHMAIRVSPVSQLDGSFDRWLDYRLNMTMGKRHVNTAGLSAPQKLMAAPGAHQGSPPHHRQGGITSSDLATEVGRGIALGLQAVTNAGLALPGQGVKSAMASAGETAKIYSPDAIAAIKGFSGTADINQIPTIWATFQTTKNVDVQRRHLHFGMEQWARSQGVEIDRGVFFEQKSIEDIVNLRFNPGQGVAQFKSAERGLSLLICRTRTPEEIERVRDREAAEQLTQATRVLEEALKLSRGDPRAPAGNYFELKLNVTTFCALLYVLFGGKCEYYRALLLIRNCMDTAGVYNIRQAYTPDICHRISWAIIDEGRSFFSTVMIQQDFAKPTVVFPISLLDSILPEVRYANQILRANFPQEWNMAQQRQAPSAGSAGQIQWQAPGGLPPPPGGNQEQARAAAAGGQPKSADMWEDVRHPKIVGMMAPYIAKFGNNVYVGELMSAAGIEVGDLPLPTNTKYISKDGKKAYLCWNAVLGKCKFGIHCKYKKNHPKRNELPDEFATAVVGALQQAVNYVVASKESPTKKLKVEKTV